MAMKLMKCYKTVYVSTFY